MKSHLQCSIYSSDTIVWIWKVLHRLMVWMLVPKVVVLIWKAVEAFGGGAELVKSSVGMDTWRLYSAWFLLLSWFSMMWSLQCWEQECPALPSQPRGTETVGPDKSFPPVLFLSGTVAIVIWRQWTHIIQNLIESRIIKNKVSGWERAYALSSVLNN